MKLLLRALAALLPGLEEENGMILQRRNAMSKLWIMLGEHEAAGWDALRKDYQDKKIEIIHLDARVWAIVEAEEPPSGYEGLSGSEPADGMYIDPNGSPLYLAGGKVVPSGMAVIEALGAEAQATLESTGDVEATLQRLGRIF
jgi:hypothetical protein